MEWLDEIQLRAKYQDPEFQAAFSDLFSLCFLMRLSLVNEGYKPPSELGSLIVFTQEGEKYADIIRARVKDIDEVAIKTAMFLTFFHHDLFIDIYSTNTDGIKNILTDEIIRRKTRYPWIFGKLLHEQYYTLFPNLPKNELTNEETNLLLDGTPQGVFQMKGFLIGPLGVIEAYQNRLLRPPRSVPLWYCADPSCWAVHPVTLNSGANNVSEIRDILKKELVRREGPPSEWLEYYVDFTGRPEYYDDINLHILPWLLGNAFSENELRNIAKELITRNYGAISERFPTPDKTGVNFKGSPGNITDNLDLSSCLQTTLIMPDDEIVTTIESLINGGSLLIPPTEIRRPGLTYKPRGCFEVSCEISKFGVRSITANRERVAFGRLNRLIKSLYEVEGRIEGLNWNLRELGEGGVYERLERYLHIEGPREIVNKLIFTSQSNIEKVFDILKYGYFNMPSNYEEEVELIEKILWKLGFDIPVYPKHNALFWKRFDGFLEAVRYASEYNEEDRERIRSEGANFFVSLEEILEISLSFSTWALLSDHFGETKFIYESLPARDFMVEQLNGKKLGSNEPLNFDPSGRNTLYPLIEGFAVLADMCTDIISSDNPSFKREDRGCPSYHLKTDLILFPFVHTKLVLDLSEDWVSRILLLLKSVTSELEAAQIHNLRNAIEHKRPAEEFPSRERLEKACTVTSKIIDLLEESGLSPLIYYYAGEKKDSFGRSSVRLTDYKGREIYSSEPSIFGSCGTPTPRSPQVGVPYMRLKDTSCYISFHFVQNSEYHELWKGYPKRMRFLPLAEEIEGIEPELTQGPRTRK